MGLSAKYIAPLLPRKDPILGGFLGLVNRHSLHYCLLSYLDPNLLFSILGPFFYAEMLPKPG